MSSLTTDKSETEPGAFKDNNTSQPSALHSTIERLKTYIYQIGKVSHNVGEETPILGGMARDFCRNVRSLVKPKERYLDEEKRKYEQNVKEAFKEGEKAIKKLHKEREDQLIRN